MAGNPANTEEMYALAAEILETLSREAGGDPDKMNQLLAAAMANPESFAGKLTPEQRAKLKTLSERVPKAR